MNCNSVRTILLVEDDLIDSKVEKQQLESMGYSVITASNGETAIEMAADPDLLIDLILMDIRLGEGMDGTDASMEILKSKQYPIVFLSSINDFETIKKTEKIPSYGFVAKNYNINTLDASIKMAFRLFEANKALRESETQLRQSEYRIKKVQFLANIVGWEMDCQTRLITWSENAHRIFETGQEGFNPTFDEFIGFIHPDDRTKMLEFTEESCRNHVPAGVDIRLKLEDNVVKHVHIDIEAGFNSEGEVYLMRGMIQDISHRMMVEEAMQNQLKEKETIVREVHHRIKNNIGSITSLIRLQLSSSFTSETQKDLQEAISRLESVRTIYDLLLNTEDYAAVPIKSYLERLAPIIISIFPENERIRLNLNAVECILPVKNLFPVGAVINEIITNSMQHGFKGQKSGEINIDISMIGNKLIMKVSDNGIGLPPGFNMETSAKFGLMIIGMLVQQLDGEFSIVSDNGVVTTVSFPV